MKLPITAILKELDYGKQIQEASANLLGFIIQDMLDYAQIKANKFRMNIEKFDLIDAI